MLIVCLSVSGWVGWAGCALSGGPLRFEAAPTSDGFVHLVDLAVASLSPVTCPSSRHPSPARAFRIVSPHLRQSYAALQPELVVSCHPFQEFIDVRFLLSTARGASVSTAPDF